MTITRVQIDRIVEAKEHEEAKLYRKDGTKLYSEEEQRGRPVAGSEATARPSTGCPRSPLPASLSRPKRCKRKGVAQHL